MSTNPLYGCQVCDHQTRAKTAYCRWCGTFNAYVEIGQITPEMRPSRKAAYPSDDDRLGPGDEPAEEQVETIDDRPAVFKLGEVDVDGEETYYRTGIRQVDLVLGDDEDGGRGAVAGASYIVQGEPGIGKSTLFTQILAYQCRYGNTLYICGEEKIERVKKRAQRLQLVSDLASERLHLIQTNDTDHAIASIQEVMAESDLPLVSLVFDSFNVFRSRNASGPPNSEGQCDYIYQQLVVGLCQPANITSYLIAQETKDGDMRGPLSIAHNVDAHTLFERATEDLADKRRRYYAKKNRNSPPGHIADLTMKRDGLRALVQKQGKGSPSVNDNA